MAEGLIKLNEAAGFICSFIVRDARTSLSSTLAYHNPIIAEGGV